MLSGSEHSLLLQRAQVQFPGPIRAWQQAFVIPAVGRSWAKTNGFLGLLISWPSLIDELQTSERFVSNNRRYTHKVSATQLPEHNLKREDIIDMP